MYRLPHALRAELKKPFGPVLTTGEAVREIRDRPVIAVGDVCAREFLRAGVVPRVIVADWRTQRGSAFPDASGDEDPLARLRARAGEDPDVTVLRVENPAAFITRALWNAVGTAAASGGRVLVEVDGEEDLATLPALILAPEGALVAYGQPNEGVVLVPVTAEARRRAQDILDRMDAVDDIHPASNR